MYVCGSRAFLVYYLEILFRNHLRIKVWSRSWWFCKGVSLEEELLRKPSFINSFSKPVTGLVVKKCWQFRILKANFVIEEQGPSWSTKWNIWWGTIFTYRYDESGEYFINITLLAWEDRRLQVEGGQGSEGFKTLLFPIRNNFDLQIS